MDRLEPKQALTNRIVDLQRDITKLIEDFNEETGLRVTAIVVANARTYGGDSHSIVKVEMSL